MTVTHVSVTKVHSNAVNTSEYENIKQKHIKAIKVYLIIISKQTPCNE